MEKLWNQYLGRDSCFPKAMHRHVNGSLFIAIKSIKILTQGRIQCIQHKNKNKYSNSKTILLCTKNSGRLNKNEHLVQRRSITSTIDLAITKSSSVSISIENLFGISIGLHLQQKVVNQPNWGLIDRLENIFFSL